MSEKNREQGNWVVATVICLCFVVGLILCMRWMSRASEAGGLQWVDPTSLIQLAFFGALGICALLFTLLGWNEKALAQKFAELRTLQGRSKTEIIQAVGNPTAVSAAPEGKVLLQWIEPGYHIALLFSGETCEGVTHEVLVNV